MSEIKSWSTTAASNNDTAPDGFPEGMAPGDVNNAAREVMASVRKHYDEPEWRDWGHTIAYGSTTTFTTAVGDGDTTAIYHANRRVRAVGTLTGTIYGAIASSSHSSQTTVTVVWDSGTLSNEALAITLGIAVDQISIGEGAGVQEFLSGTVMVFYQAAAPIGWTKSAANNDKALRVVSGSGGGSGGTHALTSPPATAHTHSGPSHTHTGPDHTHSGPSHNHQWYNHIASSNSNLFNSSGNTVSISTTSVVHNRILAGTTGSDSKLNADYYTSNSSGTTGSGGTGATGASGTDATSSDGPTAFAPQYIDVIVCSKD